MKRILSVLCIFTLLITMSGCGVKTSSITNSSEATAENPLVLKLPHNMNEDHPVHIALEKFADSVFEDTEGRIKIEIYPNAQLGSENEVLEQLMAGIIPMTKVSSPGLATYDAAYNTFGLPYIFNNTEHYYQCMDSEEMREFFMSTADEGFIGLTYYTSGSRSFYTTNKAIRTPEDLAGLKIRVQDMKSQTDMMKVLGGTPVAMAYGDVYTSLQTGIIDGTENNETALTTGKHGEVCKVYSYDEHTMIPDMLVMSSKTWDILSDEDKEIVIAAAEKSTQFQKEEWDKATEAAVEEAKTMGVEFVTDVDKAAFQEATKGMIETYEQKYPKVKALLDTIKSIK